MTKTTKTFDLKTSYVGTCQACFNSQVAKASNGAKVHSMVLHGYTRPGFGYIVGDCQGVKEIPYELSCEFTKVWKTRVEGMIVVVQTGLEDLLADRAESFVVTMIDYDAPRQGWEERPKKTVVVGRDWAGDERNGYAISYNGVTPFQKVRKNRIEATQKEVSSLQKMVDFLGDRIAAWKYAPEALKDHETIKREARQAVDDNRACAGFRRNWKDLWKYIAESIAEHKRSTDYLQEMREKRSSWGYSAETIDRVDASHNKKWGHLPAFPTDKERAAARKGK